MNLQLNNKPIIKLSKVCIHNFMNVEHGEISFPLPQTEEGVCQTSIVGLYGQNGSGKSALVRAVSFLKTYCGEGRSIGTLKGSNLIRVGCSSADFSYEFSLDYPNGDSFTASYCFSITPDVWGETTVIQKEVLKSKGVKDGVKINSHILMDSARKTSSEIKNRLKGDMVNEGSVIFNTSCDSTQKARLEYDGIIIKDLYDFIKNRLYVVESSRIADLGMGEIVLGVNGKIVKLEYDDDSNIVNLHAVGCSVETVQTCIDKLNKVFQVVVPGVQIHLGNGKTQRKLFSIRDGLTIPFTQESYGVKKIFSIIQHLISVYNLESFTLVVDEFDEGIFEFLLGQILGIIKKGGQGQLIFTSHNLRPLEVLGKDNIYFTTANPSNRYIRMVSIKPHNNLRDTYFRAIQLGGQKEELYNETEEDEIETAFIVAGGNADAE